MSSTSYDYIFAGCGAAALSLLLRMQREGLLRDKKVLVADRAPKSGNDRTWCFWEKEAGYFEELVYHRWTALDFFDSSEPLPLDIAPYQYKMIRSADFYAYCFNQLQQEQGIAFLYGEIRLVREGKKLVQIQVGEQVIQPGDATVFSSLYNPSQIRPGEISLLQHFKGWVIETAVDCFEPHRGTLMDFRVAQDRGATFVYVLPFSARKALVEYTLFNHALLEDALYEQALSEYMVRYITAGDYTILEKETGVIPMTDHVFPFYDRGVYTIGTNGGQTKGSSGYTFYFIQRHSEQIVSALKAGKPLHALPGIPGRFRFYDNVLLELLDKGHPTGKAIFSRLFRTSRASDVFAFLNNESRFAQELGIMRRLPILPFLGAATRRWF